MGAAADRGGGLPLLGLVAAAPFLLLVILIGRARRAGIVR
jgi:hypothetical protein